MMKQLLLDRWDMHRRYIQKAVAEIKPGIVRDQAEYEARRALISPDADADIPALEASCVECARSLVGIRLMGARKTSAPLEALAALDKAEAEERTILERIRRAACPYCTDLDGFCIYPDYGVAPHTHDLEGAGGFLGSTRVLARDAWPPNFEEDPEAPGCGVYHYCLHCGAGRKNGPKESAEIAGCAPGGSRDTAPSGAAPGGTKA